MRRSLPLLLLLPAALFAQSDPWDDEEWDDAQQGTRWSGFVEAALGTRFDADPLVDSHNTLEEIRGRVEAEWTPGRSTVGFKADAGYDGIEGQGFVDLRDLTLSFKLGDRFDVKVGRQVQTWGTGDLVFLNDLFPKDFVSFFAGRDDEYLKAPGNAVRVSGFSERLNADFVWTPFFEPDGYLTGERFSFFSPQAAGNVSPRPPLSAAEPDRTLSNGEYALRLFRTVEGREYAAYAYRGFFKQPLALNAAGQPAFAPLHALGASLRRPAGPGLFNAEVSYYDSQDDRRGTDPRVPNDQARLLAGYEWEARPRFTVGLQYYVESTLDHGALIRSSPSPLLEPDRHRQLATNRLTYRAGRERYTWSLFTFFSPSDRDVYWRPAFTYRHSDAWSLTAGANVFRGEQPHTFFGQLEDAGNLYLRLRYHY